MLWKFVTFLALLLNHLAVLWVYVCCLVCLANLIISPYFKTLWEITLTVIQSVVEHNRVSMLWEQESHWLILERVQLLIYILWGLSFSFSMSLGLGRPWSFQWKISVLFSTHSRLWLLFNVRIILPLRVSMEFYLR